MEKTILFQLITEDKHEFIVYTDGTHKGFPKGISTCSFRATIEEIIAKAINLLK